MNILSRQLPGLTALVLFSLLLGACALSDDSGKAWTATNAPLIKSKQPVETTVIEVLGPTRDDALALLAGKEFVKLTDEGAAHFGVDLATAEHPFYLLRAVQFSGESPGFYNIYQDGGLTFIQCSKMGGQGQIRTVMNPVIASLPHAPTHVYPSAHATL